MVSIGASRGLAWSALQAWHSRMKAQDREMESEASGLSDALSGAMSAQQDGMANLVAQQSLDRINAEIKTKQASDAAATSNTTTEDVVDPMTAFDEAAGGIDELVAQTDSEFGSGLDTGSMSTGSSPARAT
jgi:hypothetical protein